MRSAVLAPAARAAATEPSTATVRLLGPDGSFHQCAAIGTGPVDATFKAIDGIIDERDGDRMPAFDRMVIRLDGNRF